MVKKTKQTHFQKSIDKVHILVGVLLLLREKMQYLIGVKLKLLVSFLNLIL